jgi:hypothetical protein
MMSLQAIQQMSDTAAKRAAKEGKVPYIIYDHDDVHRMPGGKDWDGKRGFPFPNLGSLKPKGWTDTGENFFVDMSGFGDDYEPALTWAQFNKELLALVDDSRPLGLGISEVGQFQCYISVYEKD